MFVDVPISRSDSRYLFDNLLAFFIHLRAYAIPFGYFRLGVGHLSSKFITHLYRCICHVQLALKKNVEVEEDYTR